MLLLVCLVQLSANDLYRGLICVSRLLRMVHSRRVGRATRATFGLAVGCSAAFRPNFHYFLLDIAARLAGALQRTNLWPQFGSHSAASGPPVSCTRNICSTFSKCPLKLL